MGDKLGEVLQRHRATIVETWFRKVRVRPRARNLSRDDVLDNIDQLLERICEALSMAEPLKAVELLSREPAEEHGRSRFELGYSLSELGEEYNSLREALLETLDSAKIRVENSGAQALHSAVDAAHRAGVEQYIRLQQMRLRDRQSSFLARLAHDFRTPLSTLLGNTELLLRTAQGPELGRLERMQRASRRLLLLVDSQLATEAALSGELQLHPGRVDLSELVSDVLALVRPRAEAKGLTVRREFPDHLEIVSDPLLLGQVFQNLLDNAVKYTEVGSVAVSGWREDGEIVLRVEDTGRGMSKEFLPRVFEMYRRDEYGSPGRGVGLAVVREILRRLQGEIHLTSVEGRGSCFEVRLPPRLAAQEPPRAVSADTPAP